MAVVTERLAVIIGGDAQGAVNAFHRTGKAAAGTDTVVAKVMRNIEQSFGGLGPALIGTAAVIGPAGVIGAAIAGSAALFGGLGIAAVAGTDEVKGAFGSLKTSVVADVKGMAAPIAPVLVDIAQQTKDAFSDLEPVIGRAFADVAPQIQTVADGLLGFANNVIPAFGRAVHDGAPVVTALSDGVVDLGHGLSGFIDGLTTGAPGAAAGLQAIFGGVSDLLPPLGQLIGSLANAIGPVLDDLDPAFHLAAAVIGDTADVVDHLGGVLGVLSGPAVQAAVDVTGVVLAVKALRTVGSGVTSLFSGVAGGISAAVRKVDTAAASLNTAGAKLAAAPLKAARAVAALGAALPILGVGLAVVGLSMAQRAAEAQHLRDEFDDLFAKMREGGQAGQDAASTLAAVDKAINAGKFGLFGDRMRDAFNDESAAAKKAQKDLSETDKAAQAVTRTQNDLALAVEKYGATSPQAAAAAATYNVALGHQTDLQHAVSEATDATTTSLTDAKTAVDGLRTSLDLLNGKNISVAQSSVQFQTDLAGLQESLKTNGATLDIHTQKGRDNTTAFLSAARSAAEYAQSVVDQTGDQASANKILSDARTQLFNVAVQSGLTKDAAQRLVDKYLSIPKSVKTAVIAETGGATRRVQDLVNKLNHLHNRTVSVNVVTIYHDPGNAVRPSFGLPARAGGGAVAAGVPVLVGERRPEVFVPSSGGTVRPTAAGMGGGYGDMTPAQWEQAMTRAMLSAINSARVYIDQDGAVKFVAAGMAANGRR